MGRRPKPYQEPEVLGFPSLKIIKNPYKTLFKPKRSEEGSLREIFPQAGLGGSPRALLCAIFNICSLIVLWKILLQRVGAVRQAAGGNQENERSKIEYISAPRFPEHFKYQQSQKSNDGNGKLKTAFFNIIQAD